MQLDVWSDAVCPSCYLGHRRLEEAIDRLGPEGDAIELRWRAFQLDPGATREPKDLRQAIDRKYGPGAFEAMNGRLTALGTEAGIDYRFDRALRVGTVDAHRLIQWAQATSPELVDPLVDSLFRAYFTEGANVSDHDVLRSIAVSVGLDGDAADEVLASDTWADTVVADHDEAVSIGVTGVPAVVFNGAPIIPGAQDVDTMERILRRVLAKTS